MTGRRDTAAGFTLMEVLIAVSIVSIIGTLVYGSFARTFEARDLVNRVQERYHSVRLALERMSLEINMAFVYDCRERNSLMGDPKLRSMFTVEQEGKVDRMQFTSFSHLRLHRDSHESDQNLLTYYGEDDPQEPSRTNLMRREKLRFDGEPDEGGEAQVMCENIEGLDLEAWDDVKGEWVEEWDCQQIERLNTMPKMIKITLTVKDEAGKELPFTTIARVFANTPLANWIKPSQ